MGSHRRRASPHGHDEDHHCASPSLPSGVTGISLTFLYGIALGVLADQARGILWSWAAHFVADVLVFVVMAGWM